MSPKHTESDAPDYEKVFPQERVNEITLRFDAPTFLALRADLAELFHERDTANRDRRIKMFQDGKITKEKFDEMGGDAPVPAPPVLDTPPRAVHSRRDKGKPSAFPCDVLFGDAVFKDVGFRYKGKSSLEGRHTGTLRLPFRLMFDEFDKEFPETKKRRFHGFSQLSFANNHVDPSNVRETICYQNLADAEMPTLQSAAFFVKIITGEAGKDPQDVGLYTVCELIDDTGIKGIFGSDKGNIYEGDGPGAGLASDKDMEKHLQKRNNKKSSDYSDVKKLYAALHNANRLSDPPAWRKELEAAFDVAGFLKWLAWCALVGNYDTYGIAPHNFFLAADPNAGGRLAMISWDLDQTFMADRLSGMPFDRKSGMAAMFANNNPLMKFVLEDNEYAKGYRAALRELLDGVCAPDALIGKVRSRAKVVEPFATDAQQFKNAIAKIEQFIVNRSKEAEEFLAGKVKQSD